MLSAYSWRQGRDTPRTALDTDSDFACTGVAADKAERRDCLKQPGRGCSVPHMAVFQDSYIAAVRSDWHLGENHADLIEMMRPPRRR